MSQMLRYKLVNRLKGHRGVINALVFLADGTKLLSGADDQTVRYWDLDKGECIQELRDERWGQIMALNTYQHDQSMFLFVGTGRGVVSIFPLSNQTEEFITQAIATSAVFKMNNSIKVQALDVKNDRFIVSSHSGIMKMLCIDATSTGLEHPPNTLSTRKLQGTNGSAKLSPNQRVMAVHNLNSGHFDIYNPFNTEQPITSLTVSEGSNLLGHLMKYCSFAEEELRPAHTSRLSGIIMTAALYIQWWSVTLSTQDQHFIASGESQERPAIRVWSKPSDQKYVVDCLARWIEETEDAQALERSQKAKEEQEVQEARKQEISMQKHQLETLSHTVYITLSVVFFHSPWCSLYICLALLDRCLYL
ncbi:WD40-repeat-containing domain protein [Armillaria novae-zelandiae]|uniref:WD40-repeat-containing domain protein n=1 Tax=Armillaria novae-zelandiae TaxID=153914 RepID=A0AA39ND31_9AGAR|nr:WD40-repeat-containing domain protein [Armillaria novae-zelandiae]